jgi:hypothetical protein
MRKNVINYPYDTIIEKERDVIENNKMIVIDLINRVLFECIK